MSEINFQEVIEGNYGITNLKAYEDYKRAVSVRGGPTADEVKSLSPDNINSCSFWEYIAKNPEIAKDAVAFGITKEQSIKDVNAGNFRLACQISALSFFLAYKDVENMPIMDIGAGYGMLKDFVKEHTKLAYYGVDVYPKIEGVYPVGPDGSTLPPNIAGSLFGIIASINVFQHFSVKQRRHYYEQIEKMLYPKFGIFTVTISTYRPGSSSRMPFHCKDDDKWYVCHYGQYTEVQTYEQVLEDLVKHFEIQSIIHRCMDDTFTFHCKKKADTTFDKTPST